jgi:hypothetical protein
MPAAALTAGPSLSGMLEMILLKTGFVVPVDDRRRAGMVEEWLRYASPESLSLFMFREPADVARAALQDLRDALSQLPAESTAEEIQNVV